MKKQTIGVSVVIPSFNNKQKLFRLLNSVQKSNYPNFELIVVDNSPSSEILKSGRSVFKNVKWVDLGRENLGQTTSYNIGFSNAKRGNHILYCDEDVIVDKDMIRYLVERAESSEVIGIVTPMVLYLENKNWVNQTTEKIEHECKTTHCVAGWLQIFEKDKYNEMEAAEAGKKIAPNLACLFHSTEEQVETVIKTLVP